MSKQHYTKASLLMITALALVTPRIVQAQNFRNSLLQAINVGTGVGLSRFTIGQVIENISVAIASLASALAIGAIIYGGITYILSAGNEQRAAHGKNVVLFAIIGLIIVGAALIIINFVISLYGAAPDTRPLLQLVQRIVVAMATFVTPLALGALFYSGYLYITAVGNEQKIGRAKIAAIGAIIGLLIVLASALIVNIIATL